MPSSSTGRSRRSPRRRAPTRSAAAKSSSMTSNRSCASAPARPAKMRFDTGEKFMFTHYSLKKLFGALGMLLLATLPMLAFGDEAAAPAPTPDKGDTSWMLVSTALVLMMSVPALALFYGGMVR